MHCFIHQCIFISRSSNGKLNENNSISITVMVALTRNKYHHKRHLAALFWTATVSSHWELNQAFTWGGFSNFPLSYYLIDLSNQTFYFVVVQVYLICQDVSPCRKVIWFPTLFIARVPTKQMRYWWWWWWVGLLMQNEPCWWQPVGISYHSIA